MYLLDSNVFIEASRLYYHNDIAPQFWQWLEQQHLQGNIASVEKVRKEIDDGDSKKPASGHLKQWAKQLPSSFWLSEKSAASSLQTVAVWAASPQRPYRTSACDGFFKAADYFLVAQAHSGGHTVVTREAPAPQSKKRILIPDACNGVSVSYTEPFWMYRDLGLKF